MITEDYVSFEAAKLLKEKGFDELCPTFYEIDEPDNGPKYSKKLGWFLHNSYDYSDRYGKMIISAPTLQMAMKWLREVHHYYIQIMLDSWACGGHMGYYVVIQKTNSDFEIMLQDFVEVVFYQTYEGVCEAAIKYCLENLI